MALKDTFYISHGSPTLPIDESIPARQFLKSWKEVYPQKPTAILVISGHWDTAVPTVNAVDRNDTIYDFYGFPKALYKVCIKFLPREDENVEFVTSTVDIIILTEYCYLQSSYGKCHLKYCVQGGNPKREEYAS